MAFAPHTRLSFGGALTPAGESPEIWNCNINVISNVAEGGQLSPAEIALISDYVNASADGLQGWWQVVDHGVSSAAFLDYLKIANINADGSYTADSPYLTLFPHIPGASSVSDSADILTLSYTWTTAISRGVGSKGRVFIPNCTSPKFQNGMRVSDSSMVKHLAAAQSLMVALLGAWNAAAHHFLYATPVVASNVNATNTPITGVRVGDVMDVQRRRKNALREVYSSASF